MDNLNTIAFDPNVIGLYVTVMVTVPLAGSTPMHGSTLKYGCGCTISISNGKSIDGTPFNLIFYIKIE